MKASPLIAVAFILLAGCAPHRRDIPGEVTYTANGMAAYAVTCDAPFSDQGDCAARAGQICRETGYKVLSTDPEDRGFLSKPLIQLAKSMMIRCDTPDGLYPADEPR